MPLVVNTIVRHYKADDPCLIGLFDANGTYAENAIYQHGCVGIVTETSYIREEGVWDIRVHWVHTCPNHKQYDYKPGFGSPLGNWHNGDELWEIGQW